MVGGKQLVVKKNESVFVPKNRKHKIYNPMDKNLKIIEVQIGDYIGEDDIKRYEKYEEGI
jgi:mannose-6-phosphate isomerase-like protein (cupin superfamily)